MKDIGLALRLVRGAGRRDVVRLVLMAAGIALATCAILTGAAVPRVLIDAGLVEQARAAAYVDTAPSGATSGVALITSSDERTGERKWTRVVVQGVTERTPLPPGLSHWPRVGETAVSPAFGHLLERSVQLRRNVGRQADEEIGSTGLTSPTELYSYTVMPAVGVSDAGGRPLIAFGDPNIGTSADTPAGLVAVELGALVGLPAALFLSICARLSVASRRKRLWALSVVGMSPGRSARLFTVELGIVAGVGVAAGMSMYAALAPALGGSGLLGVSWWPEQAGLSPLAAVVLGLAFVLVVVLVARRAILRSVTASRSLQDRERRTLWARVGIACLVPSLGYLAWVCMQGLVDRNRPPFVVPLLPLLIIGAVVLATIGVMLLMAPALERSAGWGARWVRPVGPRLGLQLAGFHATSTARLVSAVCGIALLSSFSYAFLAGMRRDALGDPAAVAVSLPLSGIGPTQRAHLGQLTAYPQVIAVGTTMPTTSTSQNQPLYILIGTCAQLGVVEPLTLERKNACLEKPQWGASGHTGPREYTVALDNGRIITVSVPANSPTPGTNWDLKLPPSAAPWALSAKEGVLEFVVSSQDGSLDRLLADIHTALPGANPQAPVKDPYLLSTYQQQTGILRSGLVIGFFLSLCCFFLTVLDVRWRSRRSFAAQQVIGAPRRTLRVSAATQLAFPIALGGMAFAVIGSLSGWAFLSYWGTRGMFDPAVPGWSFGLVGTAVAVAAACGLAVGGGRFRLASLHDE